MSKLSPRFLARIATATFALGMLTALTLLVGCQAEQRPGSVQKIDSPKTGSGSASVSVSGAPEAKASGSPAAEAKSASGPTQGDGVYTPVSNVNAHAAISLDVADIGKLTNAVNEGKPLPSTEILAIYEKGKNSQSGSGFRTLRGFATNAERAKQFPQAAKFYNSPTFLDDPVMAAINGTGTATSYSPAQRRQAINKGLLRILNYWVLQELVAAEAKIKEGKVDPNTGAPHNVDEAWAFYVGVQQDGKYPLALSATARSREGNFKREGTIDKPLREALGRAQKAALDKNLAAFEAAEKDVQSRLNALFYLASARYLNEALKNLQAGKTSDAAAAQIEGLSFYRAIQPQVAKVDPEADKAIVDYYQSDPAKLTAEARDRALEGLNKAADALLLKLADLVTPADFK